MLKPTGKSFPFVSFVRARAAVCEVRMDLKSDADPFSLFTPTFLPFSLLLPAPQPSFPTLVGVIGINIYIYTYPPTSQRARAC